MSNTTTKQLTKAAETAKAQHEATAEALAKSEQHLAEVGREYDDLRTRAGELGTTVTVEQLALSGAAVAHATAQLEGHRKAEAAARAALYDAFADAFAEGVRRELPAMEQELMTEMEKSARKLRAELVRLGKLRDAYNARIAHAFETVKEPGTVGSQRRARVEMVERGLDIHSYGSDRILAVDGTDFRPLSRLDAVALASIMAEIEREESEEQPQEMTPLQQYAAEWEPRTVSLPSAPQPVR